MIRKLLLSAALLVLAAPAWAQNPTCPTRPVGDSTNACASTAFVQQAFPTVIPKGSALTLYVNEDQGASTDCLSPGTGACSTSAQAMANITNKYVVNGVVTIQYGCASPPCTYTDLPFQSIGYNGSGSIIVQGDTTTPSNMTITCATVCVGGAAININTASNGTWFIQGFKLTGTLSGAVGIQINYCAGCTVFINRMEFGAFTNGVGVNCIGPAHVNDVSGGTYTISGGGQAFANTADGCIMHFDLGVGTITGTPNFSLAFLSSHGNSVLGTDSSHFSGSATGVRCSAGLLGLIDTAGTMNSLPGNSACTATGGGYVN